MVDDFSLVNSIVYTTRLEKESRFSVLICTARYERYVPVRQDTGMRTTCYQAVLSKSASPRAGTRQHLISLPGGEATPHLLA
ncbi:hypothetical protein BHM03_00045564 [Ensete ventricosum]|nr:hypothetical protein BHM03_00045564 [Ensete ventricosum]